MTNVSIIGLGQTDVSEKWETSLRHLAWYAVEAAIDDAATSKIDAIYVGNMLAGELSGQRHLGALVADFSGMRGIEAVTVEAAQASGAAAVRQAVIAVSSGLIETALVVGVEKSSDTTGSALTTAHALSLDADYETIQGLTMEAAQALMMRRYMHEYGVEVSDFAGFSVNAHANGALNPLAMYRNRLRAERFAAAPVVADPVSLFDAAPGGDGAAAIIVTRSERAEDMVPLPVHIAGSAIATDSLSLSDRKNPLFYGLRPNPHARQWHKQALHADIDLFELHDSTTIMAALSLEAAGLTAPGEGWMLARDGEIARDGSIPISTFGGESTWQSGRRNRCLPDCRSRASTAWSGI